MHHSAHDFRDVSVAASDAGAQAAACAIRAAGFGRTSVDIADKDVEVKRRAARFYVAADRLKFWRICGAFSGDPWRNVLWQRMLLLSPRPTPGWA